MVGTAEGAGKIGTAANGGQMPEALIKDLRGYIKVPLENENNHIRSAFVCTMETK